MPAQRGRAASHIHWLESFQARRRPHAPPKILLPSSCLLPRGLEITRMRKLESGGKSGVYGALTASLEFMERLPRVRQAWAHKKNPASLWDNQPLGNRLLVAYNQPLGCRSLTT